MHSAQPTNNGKVTKFEPRAACSCPSCRRARRRANGQKSYGFELDVMIVIAALAVIVVVFGDTLGGAW